MSENKNIPVKYPASTNPKVPEPGAAYRHRFPLQMRFNDIDMVGHLNNGVYFSFLDLGKIEYFKHILSDRMNWHAIPIVVVNVNCSFYSPTYIDEPIEVLTAVTGMSERSLKMEQRIINKDTGDVKCVAYTVMAGFDAKTATGAPLDQVWASAIKNFEEL